MINRVGFFVAGLVFLPAVLISSTAVSQSETLEQAIHSSAADVEQKVIAWRRDIHQHPELSLKEYETSKYLIDKLESWDIPIDKRWVETGFTVVIDSGKEGRTVALRADLDALPIVEKTNVEYKF